MKTRLLSFYPCHALAIVFPGPPCRSPAAASRARLRGTRIWLTNICSFMVIFWTQLCKRHFPLWQIAPAPPLITLWRFANFQTLFCLLGLKSARERRYNSPLSVFLCFATSSRDCLREGGEEVWCRRGREAALVFSRCGELICCDCSGRGAIVVNDCCSEQLG